MPDGSFLPLRTRGRTDAADEDVWLGEDLEEVPQLWKPEVEGKRVGQEGETQGGDARIRVRPRILCQSSELKSLCKLMVVLALCCSGVSWCYWERGLKCVCTCACACARACVRVCMSRGVWVQTFRAAAEDPCVLLQHQVGVPLI